MRIGACAARTVGALLCKSHRSRWQRRRIAVRLKAPARNALKSSEPDAQAEGYQRSGWRQTEYHKPRFSSRHFGSSQSFLRSAADACGSEAGTGAVSDDEHAATTIAMIRIPDLPDTSPSIVTTTFAGYPAVGPDSRLLLR